MAKRRQRKRKPTMIDLVADEIGVDVETLRLACHLLIAREPPSAQTARCEQDDERALGLCPRCRQPPSGFLLMRSGPFAVCAVHEVRWRIGEVGTLVYRRTVANPRDASRFAVVDPVWMAHDHAIQVARLEDRRRVPRHRDLQERREREAQPMKRAAGGRR